MKKELHTVKDTLSQQVNLTQQKDEEIKQGEGIIKTVQKKNAKLDKTLDLTKTEVHQKNVELDDKSKEIKNLSRSLKASQNSTKNAQHDLLKLQKEKITLVKDLDEHKTTHNKLADQLHQEEMKERDLEMKVKNTQDKVKLTEDKVKE